MSPETIKSAFTQFTNGDSAASIERLLLVTMVLEAHKSSQMIPCPPDAAAELVRLIGVCCPKCGGYVSGDNVMCASHVCKCGWKPPEKPATAEEKTHTEYQKGWSAGWDRGFSTGKSAGEIDSVQAAAVHDIEEYLSLIGQPEGGGQICDLINRVKRAVRQGDGSQDQLLREIENALAGKPKLDESQAEYIVTRQVRELVAASKRPVVVSEDCHVMVGHEWLTIREMRQRLVDAETTRKAQGEILTCSLKETREATDRASLAETHVAALQKELAELRSNKENFKGPTP